MRTRFTFLATFAISVAPQFAHAADWKEYFENTKGVKFYLDKASYVRLSNGNVQGWQKREKDPGDGFLYLLEVNCSERKYFIRSVSTVRKTAKNLEMLSHLVDAYPDWIPFEPNEFDEDTYATWCVNVHK